MHISALGITTLKHRTLFEQSFGIALKTTLLLGRDFKNIVRSPLHLLDYLFFYLKGEFYGNRRENTSKQQNKK